MQNSELKIIPPESMDVDVLFDWVRHRAQESNTACQEAEAYYKQLGKYHADIAELMAELSAIQKSDSPDMDEAQNIVATVAELCQAMHALQTNEGLPSEGAQDLEDIEKEFLSIEQGQQARTKNEQAASAFLSKYNFYKSRLGLNTQEDVAKLTGIDRRYISILESGKHTPQFKTIKKLADAFGIEVNELIN